MKKLFIYILGSIFLMGLLTSETLAQFGGPPWPEKDQSPFSKEKTEKEKIEKEKMDEREKRQEFKREDIREILETMRIWKMTKALELNEEQSLKIFPKIRESEKIKEDFKKKRTETLVELEKLLKGEKPDPVKIQEVLDSMDKAESELRAQEDKLRQELKTILSPVQQAKFYIFMKDFEEDVKRMIAEVKGLRMETPFKRGEEKPFPQKGR